VSSQQLLLLRRYGVAALYSAVVVALRWLLDPVLGNNLPFATIYGFVALAVWQGGWGPALFMTVLSYLATNWLFIEPRYEFGLGTQDPWGFLAFLYSVLIIVGLGEAMRRARQQGRLQAALILEKQRIQEEEVEERKQAQEALRDSEERLRLALDASLAGTWSWDVATNRATWDERFQRLYGFEAQEPCSFDTWIGRVHLEDREYLLTRIRSLLTATSDNEWNEEFRVLHPLKGERWLQGLGRIERDETGKAIRFAGITLDITERKRVEERLKEQARLDSFSARIGKHLIESRDLTDMLRGCTQTMVEDLGAAFARIWLLNEPDNMLELHASSGLYTHLDGRHARVPVGSLKIGMIASQSKPNLTNQVLGDPLVPEQEWARREGMVAFAGYPLVVGDRVIGVMAMFSRHALSESTLQAMSMVADHIALGIQRKRAEQALIANEQRMRFAMQAARMASWDCDVRTGHAMWSELHFTLLGYEPDPTGKATYEMWASRVHSDDLHRVLAEMISANQERRLYRPEFRAIRANDGQIVWLSGTGEFFYDKQGEAIRTSGVFYDITERKLAEESLRESENRLRAFSEQLEHLVQERTEALVQSQERLRALATELNLAEQRERKRLAAELHDHLQQMLALGRLKLGQGKRLVQTIPVCAKLINETDDILSDALRYTYTLVAELSPPVLRDYGLPAGLRWLGEYMQKHDMAVTVTVPEEHLILPEDQAVLLFQSVRELLMNAWKHSASGKAKVTMDTHDSRLRIEVRDHGKGFELVTAETNTSGESSSRFGLFSIRERMRALGGSFDIESTPGQGTIAKLTLPLSGGSKRGPEPMPPVREALSGIQNIRSQPSTAGKKETIRVLVVDDHAMLRQGLRTILETNTDIEVVGEACDGEEALVSAEKLRPAVVVIDINMPKMNGIEATARLKARYPDLIIIGLSVNADEDNQEAMKRAGAMRLITKEAAAGQLYAVIQETCTRSTSSLLQLEDRS
jgi:PAS domain S-box-containing protein